jgi:hypothetical protein
MIEREMENERESGGRKKRIFYLVTSFGSPCFCNSLCIVVPLMY